MISSYSCIVYLSFEKKIWFKYSDNHKTTINRKNLRMFDSVIFLSVTRYMRKKAVKKKLANYIMQQLVQTVNSQTCVS